MARHSNKIPPLTALLLFENRPQKLTVVEEVTIFQTVTAVFRTRRSTRKDGQQPIF